MKLPELVSALRQNPRKHTDTRSYFQDTTLASNLSIERATAL